MEREPGGHSDLHGQEVCREAAPVQGRRANALRDPGGGHAFDIAQKPGANAATEKQRIVPVARTQANGAAEDTGGIFEAGFTGGPEATSSVPVDYE